MALTLEETLQGRRDPQRDLQLLRDEHGLFLHVLTFRLKHARLAKDLWERLGVTPLLEYLSRVGDLSVSADVLYGVFGSGAAGSGARALPQWPSTEDISWVSPLSTQVIALLDSRFEECVARAPQCELKPMNSNHKLLFRYWCTVYRRAAVI